MIVLLPGWLGFRSGLIPLELFLSSELDADVHRCGLRLGTGCIRRSAERVAEQLEGWLAAAPSDEPVDVVGHSMGGLVATYLLKHTRMGSRLRSVVTLGSPHRGSPAALLAPGLLSIASEALAQMAPDSGFLRELSSARVPPRARLVSIATLSDGFVPSLYARLPRQSRQFNRQVRCGSHWGLLFSHEVFTLIASELRIASDERYCGMAPEQGIAPIAPTAHVPPSITLAHHVVVPPSPPVMS